MSGLCAGTKVKWKIFLFVFLAISSCHRKNDGQKKCEGFFISVYNVNGGGAGETDYRYLMLYTNSEKNNGFDNRIDQLTGANGISGTAYNWRTRRLYYCRESTDIAGGWEIRYADIDSMHDKYLGTIVLADTCCMYRVQGALLCNTVTDVVYCIVKKDSSCRLYEVSRNGVMNAREICRLDTANNIWSGDIDEASGDIYLMSGRSLVKIDPTSGSIVQVATYTNARPNRLVYNSNDNMFYAIDVEGAYKLVKIDPAQNGLLTVQGDVEGATAGSYTDIALDICKNQLIYLQFIQQEYYRSANWIRLNDAKISESYPKQWVTDPYIYTNGSMPQK